MKQKHNMIKTNIKNKLRLKIYNVSMLLVNTPIFKYKKVRKIYIRP